MICLLILGRKRVQVPHGVTGAVYRFGRGRCERPVMFTLLKCMSVGSLALFGGYDSLPSVAPYGLVADVQQASLDDGVVQQTSIATTRLSRGLPCMRPDGTLR